MMDEKERLKELLQKAIVNLSDFQAEVAASTLIANGVRIPIRCKDCIHAEIYEFGCGEYHLACVDKDDTGFVDFAELVEENDFCSCAERRRNG